MLTDDRKVTLGLGAMLVGIGCSLLMVVAEWFHHPGDAGWRYAEQAFIFLFGALHLVVAAILTIFRRTAT